MSVVITKLTLLEKLTIIRIKESNAYLSDIQIANIASKRTDLTVRGIMKPIWPYKL